jgi:dephospho-CoA kinase
VRIAITGGIAEGKSTVLADIAELGHVIASADQMARSVFHDPNVNAQLAALIGVEGDLRPEILREAMSDSPDLRRKVNLLTHPRILQSMADSDAVFFEVPLLIETCLQGFFDQVWVVTCGPAEQLRRLTERLADADLAQRLIDSQLRSRAKTPFSDLIFRTNQAHEIVRLLVAESVERTLAA